MEDAAGKFTLQSVAVGQPLLAQSLVAISPGSGGTLTTTSNLAALLPADKIGVVLPASDLLSQSGEVNTGDRVDILASLTVVSSGEGKGGQVTLFTLQNVPVLKTLQEAHLATTKISRQDTGAGRRRQSTRRRHAEILRRLRGQYQPWLATG